MARRNGNGRGLGIYAKPTTVGNGTLSYEVDATSTVKEITVRDVLEGIGILPTVARRTNGEIFSVTISAGNVTSSWTPSSGVYPGNGTYYMIPQAAFQSAADAVKISSVTVGPNAGTRLPAEINFYDGQLFRCDNAMKPTKVKPSSKSPAGLWHDAADEDFKLFSIKGSNTANPVRIGVAVRQF